MHDALEADGLKHALDGNRLAARAHQRDARARMRLASRHGGGGVVEHAQGEVVPVVDRIHDTGQAAGEERGVAHERERFTVGLRHGETLRHGDAGAHAQARVHRIERLRVAQCVASDIAAVHRRRLAQRALHRVEAAAMRAARAEHRRAHRQGSIRVRNRIIGGCLILREFRHAQKLRQTGKNIVDVVLAAIARLARQLPMHVVCRMRFAGEGEQLVFKHMIKLFKHEHVGKAFRETRAQLLGEREGRADLPETITRQLDAAGTRTLFQQTQRLARVGRRHAAGDDAQHCGLVGRRPLDNGVEAGEFRIARIVIGNAAQALIDLPMPLKGAFREDDPARTAFESLFGNRASLRLLRDIEKRRRMADARRGTQDDRRLVALRQIEGRLHHGEALVGRGRIEYRHLREIAEATRVLLGLGRDGAGVVSHEQDRAALDTHVVQAHQRVARHVHAHLLAREQRARAAVRRAGQKLQRALLVGRPLHMHALGAARGMQFRNRLDHLR